MTWALTTNIRQKCGQHKLDMLSPKLVHIAPAAQRIQTMLTRRSAVKFKAQRYQALLQGSPLLLRLWWSSLLHLLGLTLRAPRGTLH